MAALEVAAALQEAAAHTGRVVDLDLVGAAATGRAVEADRAAVRTVASTAASVATAAAGHQMEAASVAAAAAAGHQMEMVALHSRVQRSRTPVHVA